MPLTPEFRKIHQMMYSCDKEIQQLGLQFAKSAISSYEEYKELRGITLVGKSFFPHYFKGSIKLFSRELIRRKKKLRKKLIKEKCHENTRQSEDNA